MEIVLSGVVPRKHGNTRTFAILFGSDRELGVGNKPKFFDATDIFLADLLIAEVEEARVRVHGYLEVSFDTRSSMELGFADETMVGAICSDIYLVRGTVTLKGDAGFGVIPIGRKES